MSALVLSSVTAATGLVFLFALLGPAIWFPIRDRKKYSTLKWGFRQPQSRPLAQTAYQLITVIAFHLTAVAINSVMGKGNWDELGKALFITSAVAAVLQTAVTGDLYRIIRYGYVHVIGGGAWFSENPLGFTLLMFLHLWGIVLSLAFTAAVGGYIVFIGIPA